MTVNIKNEKSQDAYDALSNTEYDLHNIVEQLNYALSNQLVFKHIKESRIKELESLIEEIQDEMEYIEEEADYSWNDDHRLLQSELI